MWRNDAAPARDAHRSAGPAAARRLLLPGMMRMALSGLVVAWAVSLVRLVHGWRTSLPVRVPARRLAPRRG